MITAAQRGTSIYLDTLPLVDAHVGYGNLGLGGLLGYEDKHVSAQDTHYPHALSAHAPSRLVFRIDGAFQDFEALVALNDDAPPGVSAADFTVFADGRLAGVALNVIAGGPPRVLSADVRSARILELSVETAQWDFCHAVWLNPSLTPATPGMAPEPIPDCLERAAVRPPADMPSADRCIATVASPGFEMLLDDMLGSLTANGLCQDALLVVFCAGDPASIAPVAAKYHARLIHCRPLAAAGISIKSVLYSAARVINAGRFLCLDADVLVLRDLRPLFAMLEACSDGAILASREQNDRVFGNLGEAFEHLYHGDPEEARVLLTGREAAYPLVVNDGVFAGTRAALLALDTSIRAMPALREWMDRPPTVGWRCQFLFNAALARLDCGVEIHPTYNLQLNRREVRMFRSGGRVKAEWKAKREEAKVLHFNGDGRRRHDAWHGLYARIADPLSGPSQGDGYADFLAALRGWIGLHGLRSMAWSFYGTPDGKGARVTDSGTLPLLALLHYLIRSNGCTRVLETGTARGVSAACLASAVAHRPEACVVTFDPSHEAARDELWAALPAPMRCCIQARETGSLEGMGEAIARGERYEAALLDSVHTAEHVWAEFELAKQLVCPGGLILIHDARCAAGTVSGALDRIQADGYGVARLWAAETSVPEDARLGLAVVENRVRKLCN